MAGKAIPELQQAVRANPKDSEALGALGQAYSRKGDRANAVANFEKALALDPHSSNNDKWNSLLKVNRYWLAIQQGDAALKANNPDRAERLFQQARNVDNTDSYAVLGLGDVAMARKDYPAAERYISRPCVWTAATLTPCAGWQIFTASNRQKKLKRLSPRSLPVSGVALMISNAACQNDRLAQQAEALENRANGRRRQHFSGNDWRWTRQRIDYLPTSQDLWQAGQRSQADTLMRNLAQQKPNDPEQVYAYGLYLSGHDQDRAALAHINSLPRAQWNSNIQELVNRLQSDQVLETANRLRESGKEAEAEAMLREQPPSTRIDLTLADWAQQRRDYTAARAAYRMS
ncbi:tetratricopeptide repeat protein [Escherichia coli]